jgi:hypothetical protein
VRNKAGRWALVTGAVLASVVLAGLAFFRVSLAGGLRITPRFDLGDWVRQLPSHLGWVIPFVLLTATLSALRAVVWGRTLPGPPHAPAMDPGWRARFHALALGGLVQNALPGQLGVFASAWVLGRSGGPPLAASLASLLLAKALEFGALVSTAVVMGLIAWRLGVGGVVVRPMLLAGVLAVVVFAVALGGARRLAPRLSRRVAGRFPRLANALDAVASGLAAVGSPGRLVAGWALSFLPVLASAAAYAIALRHVGGHAFLLGGGLLVGAVTLAQMTPGLPTSVGIYYFVCTATARALGVAEEPAAALAALSHAASNLTHVAVGLVSVLAHRGGIREVLRVRDAVRRATRDRLP